MINSKSYFTSVKLNNYLVWSFLFFLVGFISSSCEPEQSGLSLNLKEGESYKMKFSSESEIEQTYEEGQSSLLFLNTTSHVNFKVVETVDEGYSMEVSYDEIAMSFKNDRSNQLFSSENADKDDFFSAVLSQMKLETFNMVLSKTGKVVSMDDLAKIWETVINKMDNFPAQQKQQALMQLSETFGTKSFKGNLEMSTSLFPEKPVQVGDTWTTETLLESVMTSNVNTEYKLEEEKSELAKISATSTITTSDKEIYVNVNGMEMSYDMNGTMESEIWIGKESGWINDATITQYIKGVAKIKPSEMMPEGMEIPMSILTTIKITN